MNTLDKEAWEALRFHLCDTTLNREQHDLTRIELYQDLSLGNRRYQRGVYCPAPIQSNGFDMKSEIQGDGCRWS